MSSSMANIRAEADSPRFMIPHRQGNDKSRSGAAAAFHLDLAAMRLDDVSTDAQSEAGPFSPLLCGEERLEDLRQIGLGHSGSAVGHRNANRSVDRPGFQAQAPSVRHRIHRIRQE